MGRHHHPELPGGHGRVARRAVFHVLALSLLVGAAWFGTSAVGHTENIADPSTSTSERAAPPCPAEFRACVALGTRQAWLRDPGGQVVLGPVTIAPGSAENPSPTGDFTVKFKSIDHVSGIYGTPMPFSVFFDSDRGYAFHEGDVGRYSAGCIRLNRDDAKRFYDDLRVGDRVQLVP